MKIINKSTIEFLGELIDREIRPEIMSLLAQFDFEVVSNHK